MPHAAPRFCPRCQAPHPSGSECPAGKAERMARIERQRPGPRQRLYTHEWDLERAAWLIDNPRCVVCGRPATVVDHITDHRGDEALFWNKSNLQSLCAPHHAAKTMKTINERRRQA